MIIGLDTETHLIKPGMTAPRMVCLSWARRPYRATANPDEMITGLELRDGGMSVLRSSLTDPSITLVGHDLAYDLGVACAEDESVVPLVFRAYRDGRARCTMVTQMLLDVALGMRKFRRARGAVSRASYGLDDLVALYFDQHLEKSDTWRLRYSELDGVPVERWPAEARDYAVMDAVWALWLDEAQAREAVGMLGQELPDQQPQQRAAWALHLMSMWGVRADEVAVDRFVDRCEEEIAKMREALDGTGILKPDGSRTMSEIRRRVVESLTRQGLKVPMTDPSSKFPDGQVQTDKDALLLTDDPSLHVLAESMTFSKHLDQWGPVARAAVSRPVCARYNPLMETGRTSCSGSSGQEGTNFQNPPRKGDVRPCFVPRRGWLTCSTDADTIELRAHAQNCLEMVGWSRMAEALVRQHAEDGPDLHVTLAAAILGLDPAEAHARMRAGDKEVEDARQFAKIPNFGFPGGLGAPTFVAYAAGQLSKADYLKWFGPDRELAVAKARRLRDVWFETFPENRRYFELVADMIGEGGEGQVLQRVSGRIRGGVRFAAAANGFFQGRVADAMKEILFRLASECYAGECSTCWGAGCDRCGGSGRSVLIGSRPVMFLHDEPIVEHPEPTAHERAERQRQVMVESLNKWMPDVPCTSSAVLTRRWFKGAKPLFVDGRLVPVRPVTEGKKVLWVHDTGGAA